MHERKPKHKHKKRSVSKRMSYHKLKCYMLVKKIITEILRHFLFLRVNQRPLEEREVALPSLEANEIRHYRRNTMET